MTSVIAKIVDLWSTLLPVAAYTGGARDALTRLFVATPPAVDEARGRIADLRGEVGAIEDPDLRATASAVLTSLATQLDLARPSGAGPSGTGMGGVWAAADGVFYVVLKGDAGKPWVPDYLEAVRATVAYETLRWTGQDVTALVRRECLDTVTYMKGTLQSLLAQAPSCKAPCDAILAALEPYRALFALPGLESDDFATYWPIFRKYDAVRGPVQARGYPDCLRNFYQIDDAAEAIGVSARAWLQLDLPVTISVAEQVAALPFVGGMGTLQAVWDKVTKRYSVDFGQWMDRTVKACTAYGAKAVIGSTPQDRVDFAATPAYLVNLVTGGEDFAVDYMNKATAYSQLYLTATKNTSLLTMINILVHEASHGYNFVLSAKRATSPLLNLNTALEVPLTEGMAFYREFQFWDAAQRLLEDGPKDDVDRAYLQLYGSTEEEQRQGVLCAQLETYIWRVIRYVRALCDVEVNGGRRTYTDFIAWAAGATGLSEQTLHGECFTFMASPGYAPCYAVGGTTYAEIQTSGLARGVSEIAFNTAASAQGFYAWPVAKARLRALARGDAGAR